MAPTGDPCLAVPQTPDTVRACIEKLGPTNNPLDAGRQLAANAFNDSITAAIDWIETAMADVATSVASFWTTTPTVSVGDQTGHASATVQHMQDALRGYTVLLAVMSIVIGGMILAFKGRMTLAQLGMFVVRIALAGTLVTAVCAVLIEVGDRFSEWIIPTLTGGTDLGANLTLLFANPVTGPVGLVSLIISFLSSLFLVAMMWLRSAMLVLLVGTVGIAAAMWTPTYFARQAKMIIAVILVKPIAALVFAAGFALMGSNVAAVGVTELIVGATILLTSCWSWKFLVKVIAPYDDPMPQTGLGGAIARTAGLIALMAR